MKHLAHSSRWGGAILLGVSFVARAYGLGFPQYHWDENLDFNNVFSASFNHLAILAYDHGSLHPYLILIIWKLYLLVTGAGTTTSTLIHTFLADPTTLIILARGLIVLASTGTVAMVFFLARRLYNNRVAWLSSVFLAGTFLHTAESHYARTHVLAAFFVILTLYFCSRILETGSQTDYLLAGMSLGLATAAQYSLVIAALPILYAHIAHLKSSGTAIKQKDYLLNPSLLRSAGVAAISFFCVTPYAALDAQRFVREIGSNAGNVTRTWVDPEGQPVWLFFLSEHLRNGMGIGLALLSLAGFAYALIRRTQSNVLLVIFLLVSYLTLANSANFARYLIPSLPPLAILAAGLFDRMIHFLEIRLPRIWVNLIIIVTTTGILAQPLMNMIQFDYWLTQPDTREISAEWIMSNIPQGSKIVIEGAGVLGTNVPILREDLEKLLSIQSKGSLGEVYTQALLDSQPAGNGFTVLSVFRLDERHQSGTFIGNVSSISYYRDLGYDYLVTTSWMQRDVTDIYSPSFQASLDQYYEAIKIFKPTIYFRFDPNAWRIDYQALNKITPGQHGIGGPILTVYKLRESRSAYSR